MARQFALRLGEKETLHPLLRWTKGGKTPKWDLGTWATETACIQVVPTPVTMGTLVQEKKKRNLAQNPDSGVYLETPVNWGPQRRFLFRQRTGGPEHEMCQQEMSDQNWDLGVSPTGFAGQHGYAFKFMDEFSEHWRTRVHQQHPRCLPRRNKKSLGAGGNQVLTYFRICSHELAPIRQTLILKP